MVLVSIWGSGDGMTERWLPLVGYEGRLDVSDEGRVRSVSRVIIKSNGVAQRVRGRVRRPYKDKHGYLRISYNGGVSIKVHSAVLAAFIGPRPEGMETRHLDGDSGNARLSNITYSTHADNLKDMWVHGTAPIGERGGGVKITEEQAREIIAIGTAQSLSHLAGVYEISVQQVSRIRNGLRWKHLHA